MFPNGIDGLTDIITATAGLGTTAMGVVDASKILGGGPSNLGFGQVKKQLRPYLSCIQAPDRPDEVTRTLRANWLNGVPKADQKAKARSLIHLALTPATAGALAVAAGVDAASLIAVASCAADGSSPTQQQLNVLGQFDVVLGAALDAGYERGDQLYRNGCKAIATGVSTCLSLVAGWSSWDPTKASFLSAGGIGACLLVGLAATPLAPVAKDLVSTLQAAVKAIRIVRP